MHSMFWFFFSFRWVFFSVGYVPRGAVNISPLASFSGSVAALGLDSALVYQAGVSPKKRANRPGQIKIWTRTKELKSPNGGWIQTSQRPNKGQITIKHIAVNNKMDVTQLLYQFQGWWAAYWLFLILSISYFWIFFLQSDNSKS